MGGALTGEHGVGMEKNELMPLMFSDADLDLMRGVRNAFNPTGRLNPDKILPLGKGCGETACAAAGRRSRFRNASFRMKPATTSAPARLADLVGAEHVLTDCCRFGRAVKWTGCVRQPWLRPGTAAEIAEILAFAAAERLAVIPMGGRSKLGIGMPPRKLRSGAGPDADESRRWHMIPAT